MKAIPFYRPASAIGAIKEDGSAINEGMGIFMVCDGVSGPYSPSNPGLKYPGDLTGGQMVSLTLSKWVLESTSAYYALCEANKEVRAKHAAMGKNPMNQAVAGACVAICQKRDTDIVAFTAGDSFILYKNPRGFHFLNNFDQAAFDFEEAGNVAFEKCLQEAGGHKGKAWDLYFPYFDRKQYFRANQNIGQGGHAMLNGSEAFYHCWTKTHISLLGLEWMLLGTDGLLTAQSVNPKNRNTLARHLGQMYEKGGLDAILKWRDEKDNLLHISGYPESTAIELKF